MPQDLGRADVEPFRDARRPSRGLQRRGTWALGPATWEHFAAVLVCSAVRGVAAGKAYLEASKTGDPAAAAPASNGISQSTGGVVAEFARVERGLAVVLAGTSLDGDRVSTEDMRGDVVV